MHLPDGGLDFQVFGKLQEIGARNTASEHFVESQSRHAAIDDVITPVQKIVIASDAGVLWINQLTVGIFLLVIPDVSLEG